MELTPNQCLWSGCRLATTLTWVRCQGQEILTKVQTKAMVRVATTAWIVETRWGNKSIPTPQMIFQSTNCSDNPSWRARPWSRSASSISAPARRWRLCRQVGDYQIVFCQTIWLTGWRWLDCQKIWLLKLESKHSTKVTSNVVFIDFDKLMKSIIFSVDFKYATYVLTAQVLMFLLVLNILVWTNSPNCSRTMHLSSFWQVCPILSWQRPLCLHWRGEWPCCQHCFLYLARRQQIELRRNQH